MSLTVRCTDAKLPRFRPAMFPPNEILRLGCLRSLRILDTKREEVFDTALWLATGMCSTEMGAISFVDTDRQWFKASKGLKCSETPRNQAFCSHTILQPNKLTIVPDTREDERFADNPLVCNWRPNDKVLCGHAHKHSSGASNCVRWHNMCNKQQAQDVIQYTKDRIEALRKHSKGGTSLSKERA